MDCNTRTPLTSAFQGFGQLKTPAGNARAGSKRGQTVCSLRGFEGADAKPRLGLPRPSWFQHSPASGISTSALVSSVWE